MSKALFSVELPLVETNEDLEKVKNIFRDIDPYFIRSACCRETRTMFDNLWSKYRPYADSKFLSQARKSFHQSSWEMYLGNLVLSKKLRIASRDDKKKLKIPSRDGGPDFIVDNIAYVECVAPTKGKPGAEESVPEPFIAPSLKDIPFQDMPFDKIVLRITSVLVYKALKQYAKWKTKKWFTAQTPFVIAINTGDLGYPDDAYTPNVIKALFGFNFPVLNIKTGATRPSWRDSIQKRKDPVPVTYFATPEFEIVSGVIFSNNLVLNHPEAIGDDCIYVNNPFAKNPVDRSFVQLFRHWSAQADDGQIVLKQNY